MCPRGSGGASQVDVTTLLQASRCIVIFPAEVERPAAGSVNYVCEVYIYDAEGNMEAPDSAPTIEVKNVAGTVRVASTTMTLVSTGVYRYTHAIANTDALEVRVIVVSVIEGGATRTYGITYEIVQEVARLDAILTDTNAIDTRLPAAPADDATVAKEATSDLIKAETDKIENYLNNKISWWYYFNERTLDTNYWNGGGDGGGFDIGAYGLSQYGIMFRFLAFTALDNDCYCYIQNRGRWFHPFTNGFTRVTFETYMKLEQTTEFQLFIGLISYGSPIVNYAEPAVNCAHFFVDTTIDNQWHCRNFDVAEEQSDNLGAIDGGFHKLRIEWYQTKVEFYIDDVLVATHSVAANVPDEGMCPEVLIRTKNAGGAAKSICIQYFKCEMV